ncbi:MAG: hypothetical protein HRU20_13295 [Pseudomonadales bacterium]|nr:hypothetical protein [Pseudomonadales bacterium]
MPKSIFLAFLLCIFSACSFSPRPIYTLTPQVKDGPWVHGKQYALSQSDGIAIALVYERELQGNFIFNVKIMNRSDTDILVSANNFSYSYTEHRLSADKERIVSAVDPESEILKVYQQASIEKARYDSDQANNSVILLLDVADDIAHLSEPKTREKYQSDKVEDTERRDTELHQELSRERELKSFNADLFLWEKKSLRKTTLPAGYMIRGDVHFPLTNDSFVINVRVDFQGVEMVFPFLITEHIVSR